MLELECCFGDARRTHQNRALSSLQLILIARELFSGESLLCSAMELRGRRQPWRSISDSPNAPL
jgi:hypothetical protein